MARGRSGADARRVPPGGVAGAGSARQGASRGQAPGARRLTLESVGARVPRLEQPVAVRPLLRRSGGGRGLELASEGRAGSGAGEVEVDRLEALLPRYAESGPRYTSYPTAPAWTETYGAEAFREALGGVGSESRGVSLYVHVPFCRSLCH